MVKKYNKDRLDVIINNLTKIGVSNKTEVIDLEEYKREKKLTELRSKILELIVDFSDKHYNVKKIEELEKKLNNLHSDNVILNDKLKKYQTKENVSELKEICIYLTEKYHNTLTKLRNLNNAIFNNAVNGICVIDISDNEYYKFKYSGEYASDRELIMPEPIIFDNINEISYTPQIGLDENKNTIRMYWKEVDNIKRRIGSNHGDIEFLSDDDFNTEEVYNKIKDILDKKYV